MADAADHKLTMPPALARKLLVVAGEMSGDMYLAPLVARLGRLMPGAVFEGVGGPRAREAGVKTLYDIGQMSSVGFTHALQRLSFYRGALRDLSARLAGGEYDGVVLVDFPDFNLRVAKAADDAGVPVFYYVCPQFWAWRRWRLAAVRERVDMMLVVFPFEEEFYLKRGIRAHFVGHPLLDDMPAPETREQSRARFGLDEKRTALGLLPGSRMSEVKRMLPVMLDAVKLIRASKPVRALIGCADSIDPALIQAMLREANEEAVIARGATWEMMRACDFLICKSGTSTLQAALAGAPMLVVYRADLISYWLAKALSHVKHAALPNLLAGREIVPELLQGKMTPRNIAAAALPFLTGPALRERTRGDLVTVGQGLGQPGAAHRAAELIARYLRNFRRT